MCSQEAVSAAASTASTSTRCSKSWATTHDMDKFAGIIGGMRRSTGGHRSEMQHSICTRRVVLEMLFRLESSH